MKKTLLLILLVWGSVAVSQAQDKDKYHLGSIAFYNVENLFDTIDDPEKRDEEYTPEGRRNWTNVRYRTKLQNIARVLSKLAGGDAPSVIGLCEVENKQVIEDLVKTGGLKKYNYKIVHYSSPDRRGIDVALIYRPEYFSPTFSKSYPLVDPNNPRFITRDQLLVKGKFDGDDIHFIVNHWPSRGGGQKRSEPRRIKAATLTRSITDSLLNADKNAKIVIMGDLNDNPTDKSLTKVLKASDKKPNGKRLYNAMLPLYKKGIGSLAYRDQWYLFDQIILSKGLVMAKKYSYKYVPKSARVFAPKVLKQRSGKYEGYPLRTFGGRTYLGGYSDHFPVYIFIAKQVK